MKIGIDFDDTILNISPIYNKYKKKYKLNLNDEQSKKKFIKKYYAKMTKEAETMKNAIKYINLLSEEHELHIITARGSDYHKGLITSLHKFIKKHQINIKNIHTNCFGKFKKEKCQELNIELFIDNDTRNVDEVKEITNCILFGTKQDYVHVENFNQGNYTMINDWEKIYKYIKEEKWKKD